MTAVSFDLADRARRALIERGFLPDFPPETAAELQEIRKTPQPVVTDLTALLWSSIDNEQSRDLDQVEYAERADNNAIRLMVGIADVATFVRRGSAIENRAAQNTVSLYAAGKVFPMLPEELSTGLTSLNQDAPRIALVVDMLVEDDGEVHNPRVYPARVLNRAKLSYERVAAWIENGAVGGQLALAGMAEQLQLQLEAADRLIKLRQKLGALTFSSYEARPITRDGQVIDLRLETQNRARELIESFMIAANVATATFLKSQGWPIIERVVRAPRRWDRVQQIAAQYGFALPPDPSHKPLSDFLTARREADPEGFRDLSLCIVKLLGPGEYVVEYPTGPQTSHFGLALDDYSHSTAPNRRFADLVLQRLLLAAFRKEPTPYNDGELEKIAAHCTEREDAARKVERLMRKVVAAYIMRDRIGEVFPAIVTGASPKGTYVRVKTPPIEGKVVRGELGMDVGDNVKVRLREVDLERGFIDFVRY